MERRLNEVEWSHNSTTSNTSAPTSCHDVAELFARHPELSSVEKDRIIRSLESEVEAQVPNLQTKLICIPLKSVLFWVESLAAR